MARAQTKAESRSERPVTTEDHPQDGPPRSVTMAVDVLQATIAEISNDIEELENRLQPVLRDVVKEAEACRDGLIYSGNECTLIREIHGSSTNLMRLGVRLRDLLNRISL